MLVEFLVVILASWLNRHQQRAIDYLREENRYLRSCLDSKRLRFTDQDRRRLAERGKRLGRKALEELASVAHPDTILRWYRQLVARRYDGARCEGPAAQPPMNQSSN